MENAVMRAPVPSRSRPAGSGVAVGATSAMRETAWGWMLFAVRVKGRAASPVVRGSEAEVERVSAVAGSFEWL